MNLSVEKQLKFLENMSDLIENLKNTPTPLGYWAKEAENTKKIIEENKEIAKSIAMSYEKFHQQYNL